MPLLYFCWLTSFLVKDLEIEAADDDDGDDDEEENQVQVPKKRKKVQKNTKKSILIQVPFL